MEASAVLDEISRAMPPFTWLRDVRWTGTQQGLNPPAAYKPPVDTSSMWPNSSAAMFETRSKNGRAPWRARKLNDWNV